MAVLTRPSVFQLNRLPQLVAGMNLGRDVNLLVASNLLWGVGTGFFTYLLPLYVADLAAVAWSAPAYHSYIAVELELPLIEEQERTGIVYVSGPS